MFSDSEIAKTYSMSETKYRYVATFGLGPYFSSKLNEDIQKSPAHTVCFDESLNNQLQNKQFDVHVCYWSDLKNLVESRYLTSLFIGHGRTQDLLNHYEEATKNLDESMTWHASMDGPNMNLAFEKEVKQSQRENSLAALLSLGTCGLHIVHWAFQAGAKQTNWNLDRYFIAFYFVVQTYISIYSNND